MTVKKTLCIVALFGTIACGSRPGAPSVAPQSATVRPAALVAGTCTTPSWNDVVFDPAVFGRVTITNSGSCASDFLFVIYRAGASDDLKDQTVAGFTSIHLGVGQKGQMNLDTPEECMHFQRDVFFGETKPSDALNNFVVQWSAPSGTQNVFYAPGGGYFTGTCGTTPPHIDPPPVDVCPNLPGNQSSVPQGYRLSEGQCVLIPNDDPPPVIDVCPNIAGVQISVPEGLVINNGGQCVPPPHNDPPPAPSCGPFTFGGPFTTSPINGAPARLTYARSFGAAYANVVAVHPSHGGTFSNNNNGFTFTPSQSFAVVIFHQTGGGGRGGGNQDLVFIGVSAGQALTVPSNGGDVFYFNCAE